MLGYSSAGGVAPVPASEQHKPGIWKEASEGQGHPGCMRAWRFLLHVYLSTACMPDAHRIISDLIHAQGLKQVEHGHSINLSSVLWRHGCRFVLFSSPSLSLPCPRLPSFPPSLPPSLSLHLCAHVYRPEDNFQYQEASGPVHFWFETQCLLSS